MRKYEQYQCVNLSEVESATKHLDKASLVPIFIDDNGVQKSVNNFKGIYNNSKGRYCATVVPYYKLVQHKDYINNFCSALDKLGLKYNISIKPSGNKVYADIEFINKNHKYDKLNEEFVVGIRLCNSYDKSIGLGIAPRLKRLACSNGMILSRHESMFVVKHTSKMLNEMEAFIEKRVNKIINTYDDLKGWVSGSMKDSIEWMTCCKIIAKLFEQIKHREQILKRLGLSIIVVNNKKQKKKSITYVWDDDKKKKTKITRWDMYNAITAYLTHGEHITPHIESLFQKRAETLLLTPLEKMPLLVQ